MPSAKLPAHRIPARQLTYIITAHPPCQPLFEKFFTLILTFRIFGGVKGENIASGGAFHRRENEIHPARTNRAHAQRLRDRRRQAFIRLYYIMYTA
jgi:hypothetical protein